MDRAIDVVIDIHVKAEIGRLKNDINQKCAQISDLLKSQGLQDVFWVKPVFYAKNGDKRKKVDM